MPHRKSAHGYNMSIRVFAYSARSSRTRREGDSPPRGSAVRSKHRLAHKMLESRREAARMLSILPRFAAARVSAHKYRTSGHSHFSTRETGMTKYKLEYIWLDGYTPTPNLRGKTQLKDFDAFPTLEQLALWGFDGSSTMQAEGHNSDCILKPVAVYPDAARTNGVLVMCEVMMPDGTAHPSNKRATILDDPGAWFGYEQEYFFYKDGRPLGFPPSGYPAPQGPYYTGVGYKNVGDTARKM